MIRKIFKVFMAFQSLETFKNFRSLFCFPFVITNVEIILFHFSTELFNQLIYCNKNFEFQWTMDKWQICNFFFKYFAFPELAFRLKYLKFFRLIHYFLRHSQRLCKNVLNFFYQTFKRSIKKIILQSDVRNGINISDYATNPVHFILLRSTKYLTGYSNNHFIMNILRALQIFV